MRRFALAALGVWAFCGLACAQRGRVVERRTAPGAVAFAGAHGIAGTPSPEAMPTPPGFFVAAVRGDSLWTLARRHLGTGFAWRRLAALNRLGPPWVILPGQKVLIPAAGRPGGRAQARRSAALGSSGNGASKAIFEPVPNTAFTVGEKLRFAVQYGSLTAGYATLSIPGIVQRDGRPVFHIVAEAQTLPFFELFFKVHDVLDSYIDVDNAFSWGYEKHLHEGGYKADAVYDYDQNDGVMREPAKGKQAPLPFASQDVLSCFYYFRTQPLVVGSVVTVPVTADDMKSYQLNVNVLRKERVHTLAGDFDCVVVQPHLAFQGVFRQRGEVFLWVTDDQRRLPVLIRSKIVIGSININLQNAQWVQPLPGASSGRQE